MKSYAITTAYGRTLHYSAETQAEAIRAHTSATSEAIVAISESETFRAHESVLASSAD